MWVRRKKRVPLKKEVMVARTVRAEGLDLSEDGMYIYSRNYFIPGSILDVSFSLDGMRPIDVQAKVLHSQPGVGFGVTFYGIPEDVSGEIRQYVSSIDIPLESP
jgi:hypothetical protein